MFFGGQSVKKPLTQNIPYCNLYLKSSNIVGWHDPLELTFLRLWPSTICDTMVRPINIMSEKCHI